MIILTRSEPHHIVVTAISETHSLAGRQDGNPYYVTLTISRSSSTRYTTILLGYRTTTPLRGQALTPSPSPTATETAANGNSPSGDNSAQTALIIVGVLLGFISIFLVWCLCYRR